MMKMKSFLLLILPVFLFFGCAQTLHNTTTPVGETRLQEINDSAWPYGSSNSSDLEAQMQSIVNDALNYCEMSQSCWEAGDIGPAVEALDQAYALVLKIDTSTLPELIQQKENIRFMISKRILEIYASRKTTASGGHNAIPLEMNSHVQAEIDLLTKYGKKNFFIKAYKRSGKHRSRIVRALKEAGLPVELSWLPLIESGFEETALSKARALGLWQFIPSTGYKFGLHRDRYIDERLDPEKSTRAAIAYLKELHRIFGDWATVLAAYNCGEGNVLRVIRKQNVNYLDNFWDLYKRLPSETARYVPRFMATLHIINNPEKYGLEAVVLENPLDYETIEVSKQIHLKDIAKRIGISEKSLKALNPELRYRILPPDTYAVKIPHGKSENLYAELKNIPVTVLPPMRAFVYHKVKRGETLSAIALNYRTSVKKIVRLNRIRKRGFIVAGCVLKIPQRG